MLRENIELETINTRQSPAQIITQMNTHLAEIEFVVGTYIVHSFIHSGYLYSAPSRNLLRGALSPAMVKEKCLKKLAERRHVVLR